jgi:multidrug efflux system outer membrane protein
MRRLHSSGIVPGPKRRRWCLALAGMIVGGCAVGPDYHKPPAEVPPAWQPEAPWHEAAPSDAAGKGDWWLPFQDGTLNPLVDRALAGNQDLRVAAARLEQARAQVTVARADLFPWVGLSAGASRGKTSANRPLAEYAQPNQSTVQNDFGVGPTVNYEIDLFGRVRREVENARASAQQAEADFENTRLILTAQLTGLDLAQQQALVDSSAAQAELLDNQRAQYEHAIATLIGTPAPGFAIPRAVPGAAVPGAVLPGASLPAIPVGVPSDLLQRRPDVASAERSMAAANARIGVARAAYYPSIILGTGFGEPNAGWQSNALATLFEAPSRLWSLGLSATQTLFDAGKTGANVRIANQDYTAAVASYRKTVLTAMEEVENGITGMDSLGRAAVQADASVSSAQDASDIATARYKGGVDTYLEMITAQQTLLSNQRQAVQVHGQQFATAVYLVKALGGGWSDNSDRVSRRN